MHKFWKWIPAVAALLAAVGGGRASAITLTFDDLPETGTIALTVPNGYGGLNWQNFYYFDPVPVYESSGYEAGTVSPKNVALNGYGDPAVISNEAFTLNSAYFTGAWNDNLNVRVEGSRDGTLLHWLDFVVSATTPTQQTFNWEGIDRLRITSWGGTKHSGYDGDGAHCVLDNLTINEPVPEPATLALLGLGGLGLLGLRRQRTQT